MACGVKSVVKARMFDTSVYRHRMFADRLRMAPVVIAPCALAIEDLFCLTLLESMPP